MGDRNRSRQVAEHETMSQSKTVDPGEYADLSAFQRDVLLAVATLEADGERPYGLGVKNRIERRHDIDVNHGRLYPNLDDLVEQGLLERGQIDKRTNRYELTDRGRALLEQRYEHLGEVCA
jgi:DNA-binding PadR family transcriptional regulator